MSPENKINAAILKFLRDSPHSTASIDQIAREFVSKTDEYTKVGLFGSRALSADAMDNLELISAAVLRRVQILQMIGLLSVQAKHGTSKAVQYLGRIGLLSIQEKLATKADHQVVLNKRFFEIQRALGFSLTEISSLTDKSIVVTPVFDRPRHTKNDVFVIMPFRTDNQEIYEIISVCCEKFGLSVARGDDIFGASHIVQDIWSLVVFAKVIICDCSYKNPNVFYELGIAHTVGKPVILLTEKEDDIPFDLRHWRYIRYGSDKAALSNALMSSIQAILAGQV